MRVVQILREKLLSSLIDRRIAVNGKNVESQGMEPFAHRTRPGAKIESAPRSARRIGNEFEDEIMETRRSGSSNHPKTLNESEPFLD
jgi:hypothetical protein